MTFLQLQTHVGLLVDDTNFGYHTLTSVKSYLNNAAYEVQRRLLKMHQSYYSQCVTTSLVIDQKEYVLPGDFLCMYDLWIVLSGTAPNEETLQLDYVAPSRKHEFISNSGTPSHFYLKKNKIVLTTAPDAVLTLEMEYAPLIAQMVNDSDEPDIPDQFHELVALYAVRTCFLRDDKQNSLIEGRIKTYEDLIEANEQRMENKSKYYVLVT